MFDDFLPIPDAESLPFYPLVLKLVVCALTDVRAASARCGGGTRDLSPSQALRQELQVRVQELGFLAHHDCLSAAAGPPACRWIRGRCSRSGNGRRQVGVASPTSCSKVRRFTGLAHYYRWCVEGTAEVAAPLTALGSPTARFVWTPEEQASFEALKQALSSASVIYSDETWNPKQ